MMKPMLALFGVLAMLGPLPEASAVSVRSTLSNDGRALSSWYHHKKKEHKRKHHPKKKEHKKKFHKKKHHPKKHHPKKQEHKKEHQCVEPYGQCGGWSYYGPTECCDYYECVYENKDYYQCKPPGKKEHPKEEPKKEHPKKEHPKKEECVEPYGQCGGWSYYGPTECCEHYECVYQNKDYYQCKPPGKNEHKEEPKKHEDNKKDH